MAAPAARTEVVRDTYFGVTVEDPYRWLEDVASDEVRSGEVPELVVRDPADAPERVLLDPGVMAGAAHRAVDWYVPSPDGRHVACGVSQGGSERSTLHVVEVGTGRLLDDAVTEADVVVLARA
jgi:protease II